MDELHPTQLPGSAIDPQSLDFLRSEPLAPTSVTWAAMRELAIDHKRMTRNRNVALERTDPAHLAFDMMRTKARKSARQDKWATLAITAPTSGCGKSTIALILAISLAKQPELRVVLMDLDLRHPRLAQILGHKPQFTTQDFLRAECLIEECFVRIGENLAVGASPEAAPHPAELLQDGRTAWSLKRLRQTLRPDIVIYNVPPLLVSDDCSGFLANVDVAMLVVAAEGSTISEIDVCERQLSDEAKLLGVVLNKCRYKAEL